MVSSELSADVPANWFVAATATDEITGATSELSTCLEIQSTGFQLGDINQDGNVDLLDVAPFVDRMPSGTYQAEADMNQDGAVNLLDVDPHGFDMLDRRLLLTIIERFDGGPVGINSLAAAISEERGTLEDVLEPFLIQQGFLQRTARGRVATRLAYQHFGLPAPTDQGGTRPLFDAD